MKLHHTLLAIAAAIGLVAGGTAVAFATPQVPTTGPDSAECIAAQAAVQLRATAAAEAATALAAVELPDAATQAEIDAAAAQVTAARAALDAALNLLGRLPTLGNADAAVTAGAALTAAVEALLAAQGRAGDLLATASQVLAEARAALRVALDVQVQVCTEGTEPTPSPTATPTAEPAPELEPSETPTPAGDLDCIDFPLDDGTTAQAALDADSADPHMLDYDSDGVACELDDNTPGDYTQVGSLPVAIDTGRT